MFQALCYDLHMCHLVFTTALKEEVIILAMLQMMRPRFREDEFSSMTHATSSRVRIQTHRGQSQLRQDRWVLHIHSPISP